MIEDTTAPTAASTVLDNDAVAGAGDVDFDGDSTAVDRTIVFSWTASTGDPLGNPSGLHATTRYQLYTYTNLTCSAGAVARTQQTGLSQSITF